jgi:hypothetical protein
MNKMTCGIIVAFVAFAASVVYGVQPAAGVAGVDVFVKQMPAKRSMTNAHGTFALDGLAPGSYILAFRAHEGKNVARAPEPRNRKDYNDKATVASSYAIKIEGTKRAVNQSGVTSDKLTAGFDVAVEVGPGAKVRGQVVATEVVKMVWIAKELGSNLPGRWVPADSADAKTHRIVHSGPDLNELKGNTNQVDPKDPRNDQNLRGPLPGR